MGNKEDVTKAFKAIGEIMFSVRQGFIEAGFTVPEANQMIRDMLARLPIPTGGAAAKTVPKLDELLKKADMFGKAHHEN